MLLELAFGVSDDMMFSRMFSGRNTDDKILFDVAHFVAVDVMDDFSPL